MNQLDAIKSAETGRWAFIQANGITQPIRLAQSVLSSPVMLSKAVPVADLAQHEWICRVRNPRSRLCQIKQSKDQITSARKGGREGTRERRRVAFAFP